MRRAQQRAAAAEGLALAASLLALSCSQGTEHGAVDASAAALHACSGPDALRADSIGAFVAQLTHSRWLYTPLTIAEMNGVMAATRALDGRDPEAAAKAAKEVNYRVLPLATKDACYWVLQPTKSGDAEQATLIFADDWERNLVIEAPHVPEDHQTDSEAAGLFETLHAKAVIIAGAHRCTVTTPSGCRPSIECNTRGVAVESDPAHSVDNAINAMHLAFRTTDAAILQLHTNLRPELNGDALVSNGTHYVIPGTTADALFAALKAPDVDVRSCNDPAHPQPGAFCGETNTEGLASNGAADTCLGRASSKGGPESHRFIHLEQSTWRMCLATDRDPQCLDHVENWTHRIASALASAIPVSR